MNDEKTSRGGVDRRTFLKTAGGLSGTLLLPPTGLEAAESVATSKKPNFLVLVADDQCFRTIHALNNREVHTPAFDRLVGRGTTFTHCFHQGSWSGAVCVCSRAMMHTGRYLWNCGGGGCGFYPLLGETLQAGGYDSYVVGKWHNGDQTALRSFNTGKTIGPGFYPSTPENGLAYNRPRPGNPWTPWDPKYGGQWTPVELWDIEHPKAEKMSQNGPLPQKAGPRYGARQHSCELYADSAIELLRKASATPDRPFFLYLAWNAPHDPCQAPKEFLEMYAADKIEVPPNFLPRHPFDQGDAAVRDEVLAPFPRTPEGVRIHRQEYYALLSYMDNQLGRILDALDQTGQAGNTHVIVTGDHGLAVGEHGLMGKQNLYDCSVRMPFIIAGPGIEAGRRVDALMYQHCLFPTLCDLAGIATPATVQYPSLAPLLRGKSGPLFDTVYCAYRGYQRMVRSDRYKLILYPESGRLQLFNLADDPWETRSLDALVHAGTISGLFRELRKWQEKTGDTLALDPKAFGIQG